MTDFDNTDYFTDPAVVENPYPYFEHLRKACPAFREPHHGVVAVTGYDDVAAVYRDTETFSSVNSAAGPFSTLPFAPEGDDISELIEAHRDQFLWHEYLPCFDPPQHTQHRAVLNGLFTPKRLKENEEFMWRWADRLLDEFIADGRCDFVQAYGRPFPLLVIADLLGVPEADHAMFRRLFAADVSREGEGGVIAVEPPSTDLDERFSAYIEERRREPRNDMLTELATATFPDGSTPAISDIVHLATFLFIAGHETTTRLLASSLQLLAEQPQLQDTLHDDRARIPNFVEEMLRIESPIKSDFRLTRVATEIGGVELPPGTTVMLLPGAANRDPGRFECPAEFRADRPNARQHLAFGRGVHSCPGGPLARIEGRVSLERILDRMADIQISEAHHGPADNRHFDYFPGYMLRGLAALHLEFTPRERP
ncbi:cytochrome P450 [Mycobacterium branderi]|uniref:Cytochrome n=1 Tax=Mycobacterium branderi TaxID=43348 RepID=A0A7I7WF66_9MYCO|nr:cytochrome P450 [Mycobacterium branderi]MCV7234655.1 cytochrome P450 [Mycobacterium branderi]ORA33189.1 cytochrome [Mycobacterium branderi]BBZ15445.1 cytochrome P450 [Mycobacterium branderi]